MSNVKLPKVLDPFKSAQKRSSYKGVYAASDMERLQASVASVKSDIQANVEFEKDAQGLTYFQGSAVVITDLICQRCNTSFEQEIVSDFCFSPVQGSEQIELLPDVYEPVEVNDHGEINLSQILEDELILALPIVALHAEEDCSITSDDMQFGEIAPEQERENPFAVLKELKRD